MRPDSPRYDVALSFAGEQREFVHATAEALRDAGINVFYDDYEKVTLWGKDLYSHLDWVYREASRYCVLFISEAYARKVWTNHERSSAQARALEENAEYILPARFDDTDVPGLRPTIGYLDLSGISPANLASRISEKLGPRPPTAVFPRKIDRLYKAMKVSTTKPQLQKRRKEIRTAAYLFYDALRRMNHEERRAVAAVMAFGCKGELPELVHVSLDFLSRMTEMPPAQVVTALSSVRSLNVKAALRDPIHELEFGELTGDDRDVTLKFWVPNADGGKDPTSVAYYAVRSACHHFCADHGLERVVNLDFGRLATEHDD